jgi:hypothetical protein
MASRRFSGELGQSRRVQHACTCGSGSTRVSKWGWKPPASGRYTQNTWAERGVGVEASQRTADNFTERSVKGELGLPPWLSVPLEADRRRFHRRLAGRRYFVQFDRRFLQYVARSKSSNRECRHAVLQARHAEAGTRNFAGRRAQCWPCGHGASVRTRRRQNDSPAIEERTPMFAHGNDVSPKSRGSAAPRRGKETRKETVLIPFSTRRRPKEGHQEEEGNGK